MSELHDLSALEQAAAIAAGTISAVELAEHYLRRSESVGPDVGAFVRLMPDEALAQAAGADRAVRSGESVGPLAGVVCPVKDLDTVAGVPTGFGSAAPVGVTVDYDCNMVSALRAGGLVFTGKTNTPEFGLPCYTEPDGLPPARTPWNLDLTASGSSGGAGAAVAAGLAPVAQGSDGGGSIRLPAGVCGLVGIKPTRGRVSNGPDDDGAGDLVVYGPLARTVRDAAALLDVMARPFPGDPYVAPAHTTTFLAAADTPPGGLRIGVMTTPLVGSTPPSDEVLGAIADTAALLSDLGHEVEQMAAPLDPDAVPLFEVIWSASADSVPLPAEVEEQLTPLTRWLRARGRELTAGELAAAIQGARRFARLAMTAMAKVDVVLSPTATARAFPVGSMRDDADPAADFDAQKQWASYTAVYNVTGQPSIAVPLQWSADALPLGVQFAAAHGEEGMLISLAAQLEEARPWSHRTPAIW